MIRLSYEPSEQLFFLADLCFGKAFFTADSLLEMQNESPEIICLFSNETLVGFCLFLLSPSASNNKETIISEAAIENYSSGALLKTIATHPDYRGMGVASRLLEEGMSLLAKNKKTSCLTLAWEENGSVNLEYLLRKTGFYYVEKLDGYWKEDSMRRAYNCAICGPPPCNCTAHLFKKDLSATQEDKTL